MKRILLLSMLLVFTTSIMAFGINTTKASVKEQKKNYIIIKKIPHKYDVSTAVSNGDVVRSIYGMFNINTLDAFIKTYKKSGFAHVRITQYTEEGQPVIQELIYDMSKMRLTIDNTRDDFGTPAIKSYTIKRIAKVNIEVNNNKLIEYRAYLNDKRYIGLFIRNQ